RQSKTFSILIPLARFGLLILLPVCIDCFFRERSFLEALPVSASTNFRQRLACPGCLAHHSTTLPSKALTATHSSAPSRKSIFNREGYFSVELKA
ncbi:MAG: hypothetical protein J0G29_05965, partial [Alphaproteobacteria bacterium]|nr:hypothetical protein [Alphaproteobacteria bacterium]